MAGASDDSVQKIKEKISIVEVVSPYVKLQKAGKHWKGLTPFGKEKTPSFYVDPDRGSYYCFSTSQGGDHFTFVQKMEGVDFKGALKLLAEKAGIELQQYAPRDQAAHDRVERLRECMAVAESYFADALPDSSALEYAKKRGLTEESIAAWKLGFASDSWRGLFDALTARGYSTKELLDAGLIKEADQKPGTYYDRFRNRLMFPIRDAVGRTVAFTGRALSADDQAKYLNSPETVLYKKSEILFGMDRAKDAIRQRGFALLAEGQFDLLLMHQAGFRNTVALSGTALSSVHLSLIKRYADNLMLCLDADKAGLAAAARSAHAALTAGMRVKAVRLPEGKDPADIIAEDGGVKVFAELIQHAPTVIEFFLAALAAGERDELRLLRRVEQTVMPLVAVVESPIERERYVGIIARALGTTPEAVRESVQKSSARISVSGNSQEREPNPGVIQTSAAELKTEPTPSAFHQRRTAIIATVASYPNTPLAERLKSEYLRIIGAPIPDGDADERAVFEAGLVFGETPEPTAADDILREFERAFYKDALAEATNELIRAERAHDDTAIREVTMKCRELQAKLAALA